MRSITPVLAFSALALTLGGCATTREKAETGLAKALISDSDEMKLGLQVQQELQKQGVKYVVDPEVNQYVTSISNKLFQFAQKDRPNVHWQVRVIDDPKTVNAFATPGGFLYVYSGLLLTADNEAEL